MSEWLTRGLPWAVAGGILWLLFRQVAIADAVTAARQADLWVFIPSALVAVTAWFLLESFAFAQLFSRFNAPLTVREARSVRALTYLLTPVNWNLGTGAIILHLRRSKGVAAMEATSSLLFYGLIDGVVLGGFALAGALTLPPSSIAGGVVRFAAVFFSVQAALLLFFTCCRVDWAWVHRVRSWRLLRTHSRATWRDAGVLLTIRAAYFGGFIIFFWLGTRAFNIAMPLPHLAAVVPIVLLVAGLPITPGGLGTQQAAMVFFFSSYGSEAQILAYGLAFPVTLMMARLPIALLYLGDLRRFRAAADLQRR